MGVGLAGRHIAPRAFLEESLHVGLHRARSHVVAGLPDGLEALPVVANDVVDPVADVGEGVAVGRQYVA